MAKADQTKQSRLVEGGRRQIMHSLINESGEGTRP